jgi:hypothetical protein
MPTGASEVDRAVELGRRLHTERIVGVRQTYDRFGHVNGEESYDETICTLPKLLNPPESSKALTLLFAAIGRKLALKENEFSPGSGRRVGFKIKNPSDDQENEKKRDYRDRRKRTITWRHPETGIDEKIELEPGANLDPPWKR